MSELIMPKNEGRLDFLDESIRFMAEGGGILRADEFVAKEQQAHPEIDTTSCYHKIAMARYFGLVLFNNYSSYYFLTESGTVYSRATSKELKIDAILKALTSVTFGRNNNGVSSNSDIEAPVVMLKAIVAMGAASMTQIGLILYYMDAHEKTLSEAIDKVLACEDTSGLRRRLTENRKSKYFDVKFNKLFEELGIVEKEQNNYVLSKYVKDQHLDFISNLPELKPIISKDKTTLEDASETNHNDILSHNVYGIHIKLQNDALSDTAPHVCIGWSKMGDLSDITTRDELSAKYEATWPNEKTRKKGQDVGQIWRFVKEIQIGDYVVFANGDTCHIGRITSNYYFDNRANANQDEDYVNIRDIEWLKKDIRKSDLSEVFQNSLGAAMSVFRLNDYKAAVSDLLNGTYTKDESLIENDEDIEIEADDIGKNYTVEELAKILLDMYNDAPTGNQSNAIRMFGLKYGGIIVESGYSATAITKASGIDAASYSSEVSKGISIYKSIKDNEYGIKFHDSAQNAALSPNLKFDYNTTKRIGINKIFYGVPGCGKSHHIQKNILEAGGYEEKNIIRTTFYQDYSNTDFVGQILPKIVKGENGEKDTVEYIFNPGPFTLALIQAISNPTKKVALVIEEINRGNAPAIFGDIFQLLDRDDNSISEYGIVNVSMRDYLNAYEFDVDGEKKRYVFKDIKIPGNMDIFATMNTSDQNVYTLDTAFTRRWAKERIPNSFNGNDIATYFVPGMELYTWGMFVDAINNQIQNKLDDLQVNEDKQVGAFFVKKSDLLIVDNTLTDEDKKKKARSFAHKVLEYLWDDVSKLDHSVIFNSNYKTFEKVVDDYLEKGVAVFNSEIFKDKPVQNVAGDTN